MVQTSDVREISGSECDVPARPTPVAIRFEHIPEQLRERNNWVVWKYEFRGNNRGGGKWTKVPYSPWVDPGSPHQPACSVTRETWGSYQTATDFFHKHRDEVDGIGFVLHDTGCTGIDFDHCRDPQTGELDPWVKERVGELNTYSEVSPSGKGVKCIAVGQKPPGRCRNARVEMYSTGRFFTITGQTLPGTPKGVANRQDIIAAMHAREFGVRDEKPTHEATSTITISTPPPSSSWLPPDEDIIRRAGTATNGDQFVKLWAGKADGYPSHSEADQALCNVLAFWSKNDPARVDHLFRQSGLMRDKWERDDYRAATLQKACSGGSWYGWEREELAHREKGVAEMFGGREAHDQDEHGDWAKGVRTEHTPGGEKHDQDDEDKGINIPDTPGEHDHEVHDQDGEKYREWEKEKTAARTRRGFRIAELGTLPPVRFLVKGHFATNSLACIYGASGAGKSFVAIDLAMSIATGRPYLGMYDVRKGPVVYLSGEGNGGIKSRFDAWCRYHKTHSDDVLVIPFTFDLTQDAEVGALLETIRADLGANPAAVFVDTVNRYFGAADENSTKDMTGFVRGCDTIRRSTGAAVVPLHHTGKDGSKGERGSSVLRAACDTLIGVDDSHTDAGPGSLIYCEKQKDFAPFERYIVGRKVVNLGVGDDGEDITSCVLVPQETARTAYQLLKATKKTQFDKLGEKYRGDWFGVTEAADTLKTAKSTTCTTLQTFAGRGLLVAREGRYCIPPSVREAMPK